MTGACGLWGLAPRRAAHVGVHSECGGIENVIIRRSDNGHYHRIFNEEKICVASLRNKMGFVTRVKWRKRKRVGDRGRRHDSQQRFLKLSLF